MGNDANAYGGGIYLENSTALISHCTFTANDASFGGGIICEGSDPDIINCTFSGNDATFGGSICCFSYSEPNIVNTIIEGTLGGYGIFLSSCPNTSISFCDFHNNLSSNFTGSLPSGLGTLVTTNANGDSCDTYSNIFLDPLFVDPSDGDFTLQAGSPCIDAGDPAGPPDPDGTVTDIGAFYFSQGGPDIELSTTLLNFGTMTVGLQVELPLTIYNVGTDTLFLYDIRSSLEVFTTNWTPAQNFILPGGRLNIAVTFAPDDTIRFDDTLWIDNNDELVYAELTGQGVAPPGIGDYAPSALPQKLALPEPYPNPFNPTTNISFTLPEAQRVSLIICNATGRQVAKLIDGWRNKGMHEVTFDASGLASGIYIYRFQTGDYTAGGKVVLLK